MARARPDHAVQKTEIRDSMGFLVGHGHEAMIEVVKVEHQKVGTHEIPRVTVTLDLDYEGAKNLAAAVKLRIANGLLES